MNTVINLLKVRYRWVVGLSILITLLFGSELKNIQFTSDFQVYFSADNPQMQAFEVLENDFNKQDSIAFMVVPKADGIFTLEVTGLIQEITKKSWGLPYSRRVDSVTNFLRTLSEEDELETDELISSDTDLTANLLESVKNYVLNDEIAKQFTSATGDVGLISVTLTLPDNNQNANKEVVNFARSMLTELKYDRANIDIHIIGTTMVNHALEEAVAADVVLLIPSSYLLIFIMMFLLTRAVSGTLLTIAVITLTNITVFGAIAFAGIIMTPPIGNVPNMITIIAVADCMHFLVSNYHELSQGKNKTDAINTALKLNFSPMLVTSVTTAIGLLCLNFSESPPYQDLGNIVAFGTIVAFAFTVTFIPAVLHWMPASSNEGFSKKQTRYFTIMDTFGDWVIRRNKSLMVGVFTLVIIAMGLLLNNDISDSWMDNYDNTYEIKRSLNVQEQKMYGGHFIDYRVDSNQAQGINNPDYMQDLDRLTLWLSNHSDVGYVNSFSNQVKNINRILHNNNDEYYIIPDTRELLAQSNLLYEMSLPFGMGLDEQIDINKQSIRLRVSLHEMTSKEMLGFDQELANWVATNTQHISVSEGSGLDMIFAHIMQRNAVSLVQGTLLALILISVLMIWVLKSVKLGLLSLVPNIFPAVLAYGAWSILDGRVGLSVSIVATMSLGLVVDDTVHFLSKYQLARNQNKLNVYQAIRYAFQTVGVAMMITSIVLTLGFAILTLSHFRPTWAMGELLSITIVFALCVDFLLLPGLLILFDKKERVPIKE